jgi:hypothetical protein
MTENITVTLLPTVRITRVRFLEDEVFEGSLPHGTYENARSEDFDFDADDDAVEGAVRVIQREGLTFAATGNDWAANPDGSRITDYATAEREETTAHLIGFTDAQIVAIVEAVG